MYACSQYDNAMLVFGGGPPGKHLALKEILIILALVVSNFNVKPFQRPKHLRVVRGEDKFTHQPKKLKIVLDDRHFKWDWFSGLVLWP